MIKKKKKKRYKYKALHIRKGWYQRQKSERLKMWGKSLVSTCGVLNHIMDSTQINEWFELMMIRLNSVDVDLYQQDNNAKEKIYQVLQIEIYLFISMWM